MKVKVTEQTYDKENNSTKTVFECANGHTLTVEGKGAPSPAFSVGSKHEIVFFPPE
jgi:hypothetical protein